MARQASPLTVAIRNLLAKHKGDITHSAAVPLLAAEGFEAVDAVTFNGTKAIWKQKQNEKPNKGKAKKVTKEDVTAEDALAFVRENGGLKAAKASIQRQIALFRKAEEELAVLA